MTDAELDRLEALFRNPPSASGLAEHGLALIVELRKARKPTVITFPPGEHVVDVSSGGFEVSGDNVTIVGGRFTGEAPGFSPHAPAPPERPKKKGK